MYYGFDRQQVDTETGEKQYQDYHEANNLYINGVRLAVVDQEGRVQYYHTDQVDSVKVVTNQYGMPVTNTEFLPYGETWFQTGDKVNGPKYNSQELDKESGFYYYNARHYDAEIGRFVTADSVVDGEYSVSGWNRYMYCGGNPVGYRDPTGHNAEAILQNGHAIAGAAVLIEAVGVVAVAALSEGASIYQRHKNIEIISAKLLEQKKVEEKQKQNKIKLHIQHNQSVENVIKSATGIKVLAENVKKRVKEKKDKKVVVKTPTNTNNPDEDPDGKKKKDKKVTVKNHSISEKGHKGFLKHTLKNLIKGFRNSNTELEKAYFRNKIFNNKTLKNSVEFAKGFTSGMLDDNPPKADTMAEAIGIGAAILTKKIIGI